MTIQSIYKSVLFAQLPQQVNLVHIESSDESVDPITFQRTAGDHNISKWTSDTFCTNVGAIQFTNAGIASLIREMEEQAQTTDDYVSVTFHHISKRGNVVGNWDWSEVSGTSRKYLCYD